MNTIETCVTRDPTGHWATELWQFLIKLMSTTKAHPTSNITLSSQETLLSYTIGSSDKEARRSLMETLQSSEMMCNQSETKPHPTIASCWETLANSDCLGWAWLARQGSRYSVIVTTHFQNVPGISTGFPISQDCHCVWLRQGFR